MYVEIVEIYQRTFRKHVIYHLPINVNVVF